jgi:hypothetical protein
LDPGSNVSDVGLLIEQRAPLEITVIDAGRKSDFSISHPENAQYLILSSSEGDSKTTEASKNSMMDLTTRMAMVVLELDLATVTDATRSFVKLSSTMDYTKPWVPLVLESVLEMIRFKALFTL